MCSNAKSGARQNLKPHLIPKNISNPKSRKIKKPESYVQHDTNGASSLLVLENVQYTSTRPSPLHWHSSWGAALPGCWARRHLGRW